MYIYIYSHTHAYMHTKKYIRIHIHAYTGNVLLPVDSTGRVLELMAILDQHWQARFQSPHHRMSHMCLTLCLITACRTCVSRSVSSPHVAHVSHALESGTCCMLIPDYVYTCMPVCMH